MEINFLNDNEIAFIKAVLLEVDKKVNDPVYRETAEEGFVVRTKKGTNQQYLSIQESQVITIIEALNEFADTEYGINEEDRDLANEVREKISEETGIY